MLRDLTEKIINAETVQIYEQAVKELTDFLYDAGKPSEARKLTEIAAVRNNRFSRRGAEEDLAAAKESVAEYCRLLPDPEKRLQN